MGGFDREKKEGVGGGIGLAIYARLSIEEGSNLFHTISAIFGCFDHFTEDSFDESQELKWRLLGGSLKYLPKPDMIPSLFLNGKAGKLKIQKQQSSER